jgi:hypothetical protein
MTLKVEKSIWNYQTTKNKLCIHLTGRAIPKDRNSNDQNAHQAPLFHKGGSASNCVFGTFQLHSPEL